MSTRNTLLAVLFIIIALIVSLLAVISSMTGNDEADNPTQPAAGVSGRSTPLPYDYIPPELATTLPTPVGPSYIGNPVPEYVVQDLDGNSVRLTDFKGKIIVLNFWASWCQPCKEELPLLQNYAQTAGEDVQVLAVTNPTNGQTLDDVIAFLETYKINSLQVLLDEHNALQATFGVLVLPSTYFVNANGIVTQYIPGVLTTAEVERFVRELQES